MKRTAVAIAATLLLFAGLSGTATAATVPPAADGGVGVLAEAPSCVARNLDDSGAEDDLYLTNNCGRTVSVRVILSWAPDFSCTSMSSGARHHYTWLYPGALDRVDSC
ncbi:hypothetical protein [Allonocardiopsis opalescens]|uniref:Alpha amylase inhibitor n=1 Tax=Allonocardiopsis opalescens TaxID=1144618 RepID=A0A2T0PUF0_9ACTN|nr:hypothetical protein [Allonocardiopsis opalescens]PRX92356.1 hypothetical protein CLV72_110116 [Allonocardiopsis opalescens]